MCKVEGPHRLALGPLWVQRCAGPPLTGYIKVNKLSVWESTLPPLLQGGDPNTRRAQSSLPFGGLKGETKGGCDSSSGVCSHSQ